MKGRMTMIMREKATPNRALSLLLALFLVFAITIPVSAEAYKTQGEGLTIYMSAPSDITYDSEKTTDEYFYNVINTPFLAGSPVVFKIAAGNAGGINNNQTLFNGNINIYSSTDFSAAPVLTDADCSISSIGNSSWPDSSTSVSRSGRTFTISIEDEKLPDGKTYYLVINDVGSVGNAGSGNIGKKIVFEFSVAEPTTSVLSVSLDVESLLFEGLGTTYALQNEVLPTTAANKNVSYKSSDPAVAEVTNAGVITAKAAGTATVTVTTEDGEKTDTCKVDVKDSGNARVLRDASDYQTLANGSCLYKFTSPKVMRDVKNGRFLAIDLDGVPTFSLESTASGGKQSASWIIHLYSDASLTNQVESKTLSGAPSFTYTPDKSLLDAGPYYMVVEANSVSSGNCGQIGEQIIVEFPYGDAQPVVHTHTEEVIPATDPTCTEPGLTEGKKCSVCGEVLEEQKEVPALGHDFKDGKCTRCGAEDPDYVKPVDPTPEEPAAKLNGLAKGQDSKWAMYDNDKVVTSYTGLAKSTYNGQWYYVKNGYLDWNFTGFGQNLTTKKWYRVVNGRVDWNANSIYKQPTNGKWYKTTNGLITWNETGVFKNDNGWWRVKDSRVDFTANSIYKNENGWWKTTNGKVTFKETGVFNNENGKWYCKNSKVDFSKNGKVTYKGQTYTVTGGKAKLA